MSPVIAACAAILMAPIIFLLAAAAMSVVVDINQTPITPTVLSAQQEVLGWTVTALCARTVRIRAQIEHSVSTARQALREQTGRAALTVHQGHSQTAI